MEGCGGGASFLSRPISSRSLRRFSSCGLLGAAPSRGVSARATPTQSHNVARNRRALSRRHMASSASSSRDRKRGSAVVALTAEAPRAHLLVREAQRRLRKDRRMTGVAAERLMGPVREGRGRHRSRRAGIAGRDPKHRRECRRQRDRAEAREGDRKQPLHRATIHAAPLSLRLRQIADRNRTLPASTSGTPSAADAMNVAGVQCKAATTWMARPTPLSAAAQLDPLGHHSACQKERASTLLRSCATRWHARHDSEPACRAPSTGRCDGFSTKRRASS